MKKIFVALTLLLCPMSVNGSSNNEEGPFVRDERPLSAGKAPIEEIGESNEENPMLQPIAEEERDFPNVNDIFPERGAYYTLEEFLQGFKGLVHKDLWTDFSIGWCAIYEGYKKSVENGKTVRRLPAEKETEHIHCFYNNLTLLNKDDLDVQKIVIYSRFTNPTHISLIADEDPKLAKEITSFMAE